MILIAAREADRENRHTSTGCGELLMICYPSSFLFSFRFFFFEQHQQKAAAGTPCCSAFGGAESQSMCAHKGGKSIQKANCSLRPWKQIRQLGVGMQVSLLQFECIAGALQELPPTAPSSQEKFPASSPPHASPQLRQPSSSSSPCSASSSGCGRPWDPSGSPSSQVWRRLTVASPQAEPAPPSSVLIIK